jgi:hypothetical protein
MELNNREISAIEKIVDQTTLLDVEELAELQLALVGGGIGDTIL